MPILNAVMLLNLFLSVTLLAGVLLIRPAFGPERWRLTVHSLLTATSLTILALMLLNEHVGAQERVPALVWVRRAGPVVALGLLNCAVWTVVWKQHGPGDEPRPS